MGVTLAELWSNRLREEYGVEIFFGPLKSWQIDLLAISWKELELETQRSTPKTSQHCEDAIDFARAHCIASSGFVAQSDGILLRQTQE